MPLIGLSLGAEGLVAVGHAIEAEVKDPHEVGRAGFGEMTVIARKVIV